MTEDNTMLARMGIDAVRWAEQFQRARIKIRDRTDGDDPLDDDDDNWLVGWFANAIEAGRAAGRQDTCPHGFTDLFIRGPLVICCKCSKVLAGEATITFAPAEPTDHNLEAKADGG